MRGGAALARDDEVFMPRPKAADYLSERLGRRVTADMMRWWAKVKKGPPYVVILRKATYAKSDLDAWIVEQTRKK